ncbi:MAG TPA: hypothetical protein DCM67_05230 [Propionibacteriaceae bacterium]|nr:hypothetical protein [Propionibacteriaceae bacterium]
MSMMTPAAEASDLSHERKLMADFVSVAGRRAPLYARFAAGLVDQPDVLAILAQAPRGSRLPVTLFAAIHSLLLADPSEPLTAWYPNLTDTPRGDDPLPTLVEFCRCHRSELTGLVRTRVPQTNEIGRSAVLVLALAGIAAKVGTLSQIDIGASAGLNLLTDRYRYRWGKHSVGVGEIELACRLTGALPPALPPTELPSIVQRVGLDRDPVDITDPDQVRWLEACVWPDQADRFVRLRAALDEALVVRPELVAGDAVADLAAMVSRLDAGHPVITTSWVLNYLPVPQQSAFWKQLNEIGQRQDVSWVAYEAPELTSGLAWPTSLGQQSLSALRVVRWRNGARDDQVLGLGHPHGYWLEWVEGSALTTIATQHL